MVHSYLEAIILHCLAQIGGERTVYSVYHILYGKKSSQTIQDSRFFYIESFFRTCPSLSREQFQQHVDSLEREGLLSILNEKGNYTLTDKGLQSLKAYIEKNPLPTHMNGFAFHMVAIPFWKRLSFLFQVLSNGVHGNASYYPIEQDIHIQNWTKHLLFKYSNMNVLAGLLHTELKAVLEECPSETAQIFLWKLTGFHRAGYSNGQIADRLGKDASFAHFAFLDCLHLLLQRSIEESKKNLLSELTADLFENLSSPITRSSMSTLVYLKKGYSISEIAVVRQLKESTIEDHIVELALHTSEIKLDDYVSMPLIEEIRRIAKKLETKSLKAIRQELAVEASYFQIRLVLAEGR